MTGRKYAGQTVIELLVSSGVFLIMMISVISMVFGSRSLISDTSQARQAINLAEEGLEAARLLRDQEWNNLIDGTHGITKPATNWQLNGISDVQNGYTRTITISANSANSKKIVSTVRWTALPARTSQVTLSTILTNWANVTTGDYISGDWRVPVSLATASVEPSGNNGVDVEVENKFVYLGTSHAATDKFDLHIFDVTDPALPVKKSSLDLDIKNLSQLGKGGSYVYVVNRDTANQVSVVNVADPVNPLKIASYLVANTSKPISVAVAGNTLYVGMENNASGAELFAINITDPVNPVALGSLEIGGNVNAIAVYGQALYLATSLATRELTIVNATTPATMAILGGYDASGSEAAMSVIVKSVSDVYLGRATVAAGPEFLVINSSDPAASTLKGTFELGATVNDFRVISNLAFLGTNDSNNEVKILNVGNPAAILRHDTTQLNFPQDASGIAFENNKLFVAVRSNAALRILTSSP